MSNYDTHHYDNEKLKQSATFLAALKLDPITDLEQVRRTIGDYIAENPSVPRLSDWCFLDGKCSLVVWLIIHHTAEQEM